MGMLIKCIYAVIKFNNGEIVNRLLSGDSSKLNINFEEVGGFKFGRRMLEKKTYIMYEDGTIHNIDVQDYFYIDFFNTENYISVIFYNEKYFFNGDYFSPPNNAAIYNIDGTLKHQLLLPKEGFWTPDSEGWYIHSTYYADFPNLKGWGVMVTNDIKWPDLCFCLYNGTPNLIWTKYSQERR